MRLHHKWTMITGESITIHEQWSTVTKCTLENGMFGSTENNTFQHKTIMF